MHDVMPFKQFLIDNETFFFLVKLLYICLYVCSRRDYVRSNAIMLIVLKKCFVDIRNMSEIHFQNMQEFDLCLSTTDSK